MPTSIGDITCTDYCSAVPIEDLEAVTALVNARAGQHQVPTPPAPPLQSPPQKTTPENSELAFVDKRYRNASFQPLPHLSQSVSLHNQEPAPQRPRFPSGQWLSEHNLMGEFSTFANSTSLMVSKVIMNVA